MPKNWCFQNVVLEKALESPLDSKEIKLVGPKGNEPWIFIGRTHAETEAPVLWPPDMKSWLTGKDPDAGKERRQGEKGTTEDEMVGWHQRASGHEFEQTPRDGEGQGRLARCSPWGRRESDTPERLKNSSGCLQRVVYTQAPLFLTHFNLKQNLKWWRWCWLHFRQRQEKAPYRCEWELLTAGMETGRWASARPLHAALNPFVVQRQGRTKPKRG